MRVRPLALAAVSGLVLTTVAGATGATAAGAVVTAGHHHRPSPPQVPTTVATGLDNPRHLSFDGRTLYVAEAGLGGEGPCAEGPEGLTCLGATGAVTQITWHSQRNRSAKRARHHKRGSDKVRTKTVQRRVLTGLPSLAGEGGNQAGGPTDVR